MTDVKQSVTPFNGTNFQLWKHHISMLLASKGLDKHLKSLNLLKKDNQYNKNTITALVIITLALTDTQLQKVLHCKTAFDVIHLLSEEYASQSITHQILLKQ
jgi:hypothetical protein